MKRNIIFALILIISVNLLSCKKENAVNNEQPSTISNLQSGNNSLRENPVTRPLKGTFTIAGQVLQGPPNLHQILTGQGNATHLGNMSFSSDVYVAVTGAPPFQVNGTAVFTAANGDQFFTSVSGLSTPADEVVARINHTITGGTGRFENASGSFNATTIGHTVTLEGQISY
ncbi:MAG TPA: hypothetical protein VFT78_13735 [Hanamia sp.]|nr:hypothetical protein [Hanamia sp.]